VHSAKQPLAALASPWEMCMLEEQEQMRTKSSRRLACATATFLIALTATNARAQVFASEHGVSAQTVNGTTFTVEYFRPVARGRELFGKLVKWDRPWTPGANWATTLDVDHDVTIEGQALPKGKYGIWAIPKADEWTLILHKTARAFHTQKPAADDELLRLKVKPVQSPQHVEILTWSFPVVKRDGAELHLNWGTTDVAVHLGVGPSAKVTALTAEERAKYVGTYTMTHLGALSRVRTSTYTVFDSAGVLRLRRSDPPDTYYDAQYDLNLTGERTFVPIMYRGGVLVGAEPAMTVIFTFEGGRATGVEVKGVGGATTMARGVLQP
jgi:hypothetical protein